MATDLRKRQIDEIPRRLQKNMKEIFKEREELKGIETTLDVAKNANTEAFIKVCDALEIDQVLTDTAMMTIKFAAPRLSKERLAKALVRVGMTDKEIDEIISASMGEPSDKPFVEFRFRANGKR